ncbi:MAG: hypothetical protein EOQ92_18230 [Mesorhizobium sp.]|nr:MAG: hypothetical protein EOQ92_18230 [Mesorhizobium sp.]RWK48454.1 MAG: hypothetical protein EOR47_17890 [Mesorhizobium sp.]RWK94247.1 MAG: hypothetical protein EOR53_19190 [Mesorhizobium sp.]RWL11882.1 MAG: hypothetical protein EOR45_05095 [Mesorhizobium sp.]TIP61295.1 MAG: hypothetical protein E5X56_01775 [Mesorhizobium sp.]
MISPLEGEMSPKATEGVASHGAPSSIWCSRPSPVGPTPSGLPAISPSRGEITASTPPSAGAAPLNRPSSRPG